jgi:hypothetical protein
MTQRREASGCPAIGATTSVWLFVGIVGAL